MAHVFLSHNPFTVQTAIKLDGQTVDARAPLAELVNGRLQRWIDHFFVQVLEDLNSPSRLDVEFEGLETDFCDVEQAAQQAGLSLGAAIRVSHQPVTPAAGRLARLKEMFDDAVAGPLEELSSEDFKSEFEDAMEPTFDVNVIATMKAGKSTLINAMMGADIAPSNIEACTATIARIRDKDDRVGFRARRMDENGCEIDAWQDADRTLIEVWNSDPTTREIEIEGNIPSIREQEHASLVLVDTPGPNNARNANHGIVTNRLIADKRMPVVMYVLNAQGFGTDDDKRLLVRVKEAMVAEGRQARDRFLFVMSKADRFDPEKGSTVAGAIENVKKYLQANGIEDAHVYPASALVTKLARIKKRTPEGLTRLEKGDLQTAVSLFVEEPSMHFLQYMPVSRMVKSKVERMLAEAEAKGDLEEQASIHGGVPVLEAVIEEYLVKYSYPIKVTDAKNVLEKFLAVAKGQEAVYVAMAATSETELAEVLAYLTNIRAKQNDAKHSKKLKEELRLRSFEPSSEVKKQRRAIVAKFEQEKMELGNKVNGEKITPKEAEKVIASAQAQARQAREEVICKYQEAIEDACQEYQRELLQAYQKHVVELFGGSGDEATRALPAVEALKVSAVSLPTVMTLVKSAKFEKRERTGSHQESDSRWWNPFSWGRTKTVYEYGNVEYVDLSRVWAELEPEISNDFQSVCKSAEAEMARQCKVALEAFIVHMEERLDKEISKLLKSYQEKSKDKKALERALAEAKSKIAWISQFETRLCEMLALPSELKAKGA